MIELGRVNQLIVNRSTAHGVYLINQERTAEVLLPNKFVSPKLKVDDKIEVFIFTNTSRFL